MDSALVIPGVVFRLRGKVPAHYVLIAERPIWQSGRHMCRDIYYYVRPNVWQKSLGVNIDVDDLCPLTPKERKQFIKENPSYPIPLADPLILMAATKKLVEEYERSLYQMTQVLPHLLPVCSEDEKKTLLDDITWAEQHIHLADVTTLCLELYIMLGTKESLERCRDYQLAEGVYMTSLQDQAVQRLTQLKGCGNG